MKIQQLMVSLLKDKTRRIEYPVFVRKALLTAFWLVNASAVQAARRDLEHRTAAEYGSVVADYDGDGRTDISVKRDGGTWQIDLAANGFGSWDATHRGYGGLEAIPVPADYNGDGKADLSVKTTAGVWYINYTPRNGFPTRPVQFTGYGDASARPVPADYDGDGKADLSVWDDFGVWHIDYAGNGFGTWDVHVPSFFNGPQFEPVPADYDGDGKADRSLKSDTGVWYIDYARNGFGQGFFQWDVALSSYGDAFARPVPADYDGDGKADLSVKEDAGTWRIDFAANGFGAWDVSFASVAGRPIPGNYDLTPGAELAVRPDCGSWYIHPSVPGDVTRWQRIDSTDVWRNTVTVRDRDSLLQTLRSDDFQGVITIPSTSSISVTGPWSSDPNDLNLVVRSCTHLKGTRSGLDPGALLYDENRLKDHAAFNVSGHDIKIEGLRLRGPQVDRSSSQAKVKGMWIDVNPTLGTGRNVLITNNEWWYWTESGVSVTGFPRMTSNQAGHVSVLRNYIHQNAMDTRGYGVHIGQGGYALIEGNLFDRNRHAIAASWGPGNGYIARDNYILAGGYTECPSYCYYNQHFDAHGEFGGEGGRAGASFNISYNTFRGEQTWIIGQPTRAAFLLRGKPTNAAYFFGNVVVHNSAYDAARTKEAGCGTNEECNLIIGVNSYNTDLSLDAAVAGDLDGDGLDDIFLANGTGWWYSSAGQTEWRFLRRSSLRLSALHFGDFDGDGRADVLETSPNLWRYYPGGSGGPIVLRTEGAALTSDDLLGDFDCNGKTDVLSTTGSQWFLSLNASGPGFHVLDFDIGGSQLRVGNFDTDICDEVFSRVGSAWAVWNFGTNGWVHLRTALSSDVSSLVVADFDADGRSDIAQTSGSGWRYSSGGTSGWLSLPGASDLPFYYRDIRKALIGHFNGDGQADAVRFQMTFQLKPGGSFEWVPHDQATFVGWNGLSSGFTAWSPEIHMR